jgi:uncharacterized membrane protein
MPIGFLVTAGVEQAKISRRILWFLGLTTLLGIVLHFTNIDLKVYWHDEIYTSLWISGFSLETVKAAVFNGTFFQPEALQKYLYPTSDTTLFNTIQNLAVDDPHHPPLYYALLRLWVEGFGNSIAVIRGFSVMLSLLFLPALYWLCWELFQSAVVGRVAIALVAVAPWHLLLAQDARQYYLWILLIVLASAALLRALRRPSVGNWLLYGATLTLGFYTFLFFVLTCVSHGLYVLITQRFRVSRPLVFYGLSNAIAAILFLPWVYVILSKLNRVSENTGWTDQTIPLIGWVKNWLGNLSRIFFDFNLDTDSSLLFSGTLVLLTLALLGYGFYSFLRQAPPQPKLFLLLLIGVHVLALVMPDLLLGRRLSVVFRYMLPAFLGIELVVAYGLARSLGDRRRWLWEGVTTFVILGGLVSSLVCVQSDTWWNKKPSHFHPRSAQLLNQAEAPLLIGTEGDANFGDLLSLGTLLENTVTLQFFGDPEAVTLPPTSAFSDVFLFNPGGTLRQRLEEQTPVTLTPIYRPGRLWRVDDASGAKLEEESQNLSSAL